ncbi:hypothetical protein J1N35_025481 [Gossypium stocksii]|uniref:Uncharacterized protein n=1 Tax=Gossypium stocksii TaxID=47602 RepID=A0A9D3V927_9ROSI|nr:hypothetical protein J1N35_025481 [Gossypium stocksii]
MPLLSQSQCCRTIVTIVITSLLQPSSTIHYKFLFHLSKLSLSFEKNTMSPKRTRSSKTSAKNPIVIQDKEVKERFDSIFKNQPIMPKKSFMPISHSSTISMKRILLFYYDKKVYQCWDNYSKGDSRLYKEEGRKCLLSIINYFTLLRAQVRSKANLKVQYVQGCITRHDVERLVEKVGLLNQMEPNEPNEPEYDESSTKSKPKADSTNAT